VGRHSSPAQWPFYRSVVGWLLPWAMIAAVIGIAVWVAVATVGGDDPASPALSSGRQQSPKPKTSPPAPIAVATKSPKEEKKPEPEPSKSDEVLPKLITNGISVQVLDASGSPGSDRAMADRLTELGFDIAAVVPASKLYDHTTVFWSSNDTKAAAEALAEHFGWIVEPKPPNLSADVSVHVVVGKDEAKS
jgi:LytR cell envelope-related transcriptional attenuator